MDGTINMSLGGKVDYGVRLVLLEDVAYQGSIADVALDKDMVAVIFKACKVIKVAGTGQFIQVHNESGIIIPLLENKIGTNKSRPTVVATLERAS